MLLLGAHMSIAGGFEKALERGNSIGCTCIQIFTKSNRQWHATPIIPEEITKFAHAQKEYPAIKSIVAHASYLLNIGSADGKIRHQSRTGLLQELERCDALSIPYLVFHPGSATNCSSDECMANVAESINAILEQFQGKTMLIIENTAGQGNVIGSTFQELKAIYHGIEQKKRVGFCLDTCHLFAAGYDLRTSESYENTIQQFDKLLGLETLKVIHVNDSKKELGSHVDRHEDIGKGALGLEGFRLLFNDKRLAHVPKILETPKESLEDDKKNMEIILGLIK